MVFPLLILLCFTFACQQGEEVAEEPAVDVEAERTAIQETFSSWIKANYAKDADGMASFFTLDSDSYLDSQIRNIWQLKESWIETFSLDRYATVHPAEKIVVSDSGDMAYLIFGAQFNYVDYEGVSNTSDKYYSLMVWRKQADGSWKIVAFK